MLLLSFSLGTVFSCVSYALYSQVAQLPTAPTVMPYVQARVAIQGITTRKKWCSFGTSVTS